MCIRGKDQSLAGTPCVSAMISTLASAFFMNYFVHRQKLQYILSRDMHFSYAIDH